MPHINNMSGGHDQVASAFIIRTDTPEPRVVMHMHKKLGRYLQFGGHIEPKEDPWETLTHEIKEESGYDMSQLQVLQPRIRLKNLRGIKIHPMPFFYHTHPFDDDGHHYHSDVDIAFITGQPPASKPAAGEVQELYSFSLQDLRKLSDTELFPNVLAISTFLIEEILPNWEAVSVSEFSLATNPIVHQVAHRTEVMRTNLIS